MHPIEMLGEDTKGYTHEYMYMRMHVYGKIGDKLTASD